MKKILYPTCLLIIAFCINSCSPRKVALVIEIKNHNSFDLVDQTFGIKVALWEHGNEVFQLYQDGKQIPSQFKRISESSTDYRLYFQTDIPANGVVKVKVESVKEVDNKPAGDIKKTLAELWYKEGGYFEGSEYKGGEFKPFQSLRVPDECTDHSLYIKYEGPGWESDKVGYRLYLDWRNAIDIYGKKVSNMVLPGVGLDGYESYHNMSDWGMDVLKVGPSLGIGTIGYWNGKQAERVAETDSIYCQVAENGNLHSEIVVDYYGWKIAGTSTDLHSSLSILAGSRATHHVVSLSNDIPNLCTGIVKLENTILLKGDSTSGWNYIATWGNQSLAKDNLGMAVIFRQDILQEITQDENSHVVVLKPEGLQVDYYFLAAWEKEPEGIKSLQEFQNYLNEFISFLNQPLTISFDAELKDERIGRNN